MGRCKMDLLQDLGVDGPKLIAQLINFAIVLFVLWRFAYKPVLEMLENRRQKICLLYTSPSPRDKRQSRMPSSA